MRILLLILLLACCRAACADTAVEPPAAVTQDIPYKQEAGQGGASLLKVVIVMGLLLGLAVGSLFLVKRSALGGKLGITESKLIKLIELKRLSPRLNVYLVSIGKDYYVLAQSGESISIVKHHGVDGLNADE